MKIRYMEDKDKDFVMSIDKHVDNIQYRNHVFTKSGFVLWEGNCPVGIMHYCVLWDNMPFLNLIYIKDEYRGCGFGACAMKEWEEEMKELGYKMVLISTQVDECAQHFYRKLGYTDCGGLLFNNTPLDQPMEMFMNKVIESEISID